MKQCSAGRITRYVRDVLVRELADGLPAAQILVARAVEAVALGRWTSYSGDARNRVRKASGALRAATAGGLASSPDLMTSCFARSLPDDEA